MMKRRLTRQRQAILEILRGRRDHPTAEQVYGAIRAIMPRVSLGTVYRNLEVLQAMGHVRVIDGPSEPRRFDGNEAVHDHFRCSVCGMISDVPAGAAREPGVPLPGFIIQACRVEFIGICPSCSVLLRRRGMGARGPERPVESAAASGG